MGDDQMVIYGVPFVIVTVAFGFVRLLGVLAAPLAVGLIGFASR